MSWRQIGARPSATTMLFPFRLLTDNLHHSYYKTYSALQPLKTKNIRERTATRWFPCCWRVNLLIKVTPYGTCLPGQPGVHSRGSRTCDNGNGDSEDHVRPTQADVNWKMRHTHCTFKTRIAHQSRYPSLLITSQDVRHALRADKNIVTS